MWHNRRLNPRSGQDDYWRKINIFDGSFIHDIIGFLEYKSLSVKNILADKAYGSEENSLSALR